MPRRRPIEVFNLSFLDCLCCGFGAILLLFILTIGSGAGGVEGAPEPAELEALRAQLSALEESIARQTEQLQAVNDPAEREEAAAAVRTLEATQAALQQERSAIESKLGKDQKTRAEARRLLKSFDFENLPPIGLPTEATHIAFVVDTSGSMRHPFTKQLHEGVLNRIRDLLEQLPKVRAIQFIDSSGNYVLQGSRASWLSDSPGLRAEALRALRFYPKLSVSDPVPGITRAFKDLRSTINPDESMAIYMLGDDFRGSTTAFLVRLDALNPRSTTTGKRPVSINAIGFPTLANPFQQGNPQGNVRFANIMREVADDHNGVLILEPRI